MKIMVLGELYKVVEAMFPLYVMFILGYGSFGSIGKTAHDTFSKLLYYFVLPCLTFQLTSHIDPYNLNIHFLFADFISKFLILVCLALWATRSSRPGRYDWSITSFSLSSLTNSLIVGVPFVQVMYGQSGVDLVVQGSAVQAIVWLTGLLLVLEHRQSRLQVPTTVRERGTDVEGAPTNNNVTNAPSFFRVLFQNVFPKLLKNPNFYACPIGLTWAFIAKRKNIEMPPIVENSVGIMSDMGTGSAMLNLAAMTIGSLAMRLKEDVLRVAIIQAAIPLSITSFIYGTEYDLHPEVLSTAVIFGAIISLPVLVAYYYAILKLT